MIRVYPYRRGSRSARALANALGGRRLAFGEKTGLPERCTVINWGASECPYPKALNNPDAVRLAANKSLAFERLAQEGVSVPAFARRREDVSWQGLTVVRHKLTGHGGEGIEILDASSLSETSAPLYVEYIKKTEEYRVHVIGDEIVLVQRKARRRDTPKEEVNYQVRNHQNGFVFVRNDVNPPDGLSALSIAAVRGLGLDFGAVDLIFNEKKQKSFVLEVNTAPGLEGSSPNDYARGFRRLLQQDQGA